jgi:hypothetical protein
MVQEFNQFNAVVVRHGVSQEVAAQVTESAAAVSEAVASRAAERAAANSVAASDTAVPNREDLPGSIIHNVGAEASQGTPSADQLRHGDQSWDNVVVDEDSGHYGRHDPMQDSLMHTGAGVYLYEARRTGD